MPPGVWRRGLPKGPATPEALEKYEVTYTAGGATWHRVKDTTQKPKDKNDVKPADNHEP